MSSREAKPVESEDTSPILPNPSLPAGLRLLCIGQDEPSWASLTIKLDAAGCTEPEFRWVLSAADALASLRDESYDCMLVSWASATPADRQIPETPVSLLSAIRASGCDDPIVLLAPAIRDSLWPALVELDCEVLVTSDLWESMGLIPVIKRSMARVEIRRENHRLTVGQHRRLLRERDEAEHLLQQQRQILGELHRLSGSAMGSHDALKHPTNADRQPEHPEGNRFELPEEVSTYYQELLRTYVIMGDGSLGDEIAELAELVALAELSPRETLELHLERVEMLVKGLGSRSCRHVMARADLLALELMMHLGECYQKRSADRGPNG